MALRDQLYQSVRLAESNGILMIFMVESVALTVTKKSLAFSLPEKMGTTCKEETCFGAVSATKSELRVRGSRTTHGKAICSCWLSCYTSKETNLT